MARPDNRVSSGHPGSSSADTAPRDGRTVLDLTRAVPQGQPADLLNGKFLPLKAAAQALRKNPQTLRRWGQRALDPLPIYRLGRDEYLHVDVSLEWILRQRQQPIEEPKLGRPTKRHA